MVKWRLSRIAVVVVALPAGAAAQIPPPVAPAPTPHFNPSSPYILPQTPEVPVSPGPGPGAAAVMHGTPDVIDPHPAPHYHHRKRRRLDDY